MVFVYIVYVRMLLLSKFVLGFMSYIHRRKNFNKHLTFLGYLYFCMVYTHTHTQMTGHFRSQPFTLWRGVNYAGVRGVTAKNEAMLGKTGD